MYISCVSVTVKTLFPLLKLTRLQPLEQFTYIENQQPYSLSQMLTTCYFFSLTSPLPSEMVRSFSIDRPFEENSLCIPMATKHLGKEFHYNQEEVSSDSKNKELFLTHSIRLEANKCCALS
jgi:hypothetical protein